MNRAERRRAARVKHRLVELRKIPPGHPLAAIQLAEGQKAWTCSCNGGWLSVSNESPDESFATHVESEKTKLAEKDKPFVKPPPEIESAGHVILTGRNPNTQVDFTGAR